MPNHTSHSTNNVLVAEIPQSGDRPAQVNFDHDTFTGFFGASTTASYTANFSEVFQNGTIGANEVRPAVVRQSSNYSFELNGAKAIPPLSPGQHAIGIFKRIDQDTFWYMLTMPGEPAHTALDQLLGTIAPPGPKMRRVPLPAHRVQSVWPDSPLWKQLSI